MSNYPDDVHMHDDHPLSPFHDAPVCPDCGEETCDCEYCSDCIRPIANCICI